MSWYERIGWKPSDTGPIFRGVTDVLEELRKVVLEVVEKHHLSIWETVLFLQLMAHETTDYLLMRIELEDNRRSRR